MQKLSGWLDRLLESLQLKRLPSKDLSQRNTLPPLGIRRRRSLREELPRRDLAFALSFKRRKTKLILIHKNINSITFILVKMYSILLKIHVACLYLSVFTLVKLAQDLHANDLAFAPSNRSFLRSWFDKNGIKTICAVLGLRRRPVLLLLNRCMVLFLTHAQNALANKRIRSGAWTRVCWKAKCRLQVAHAILRLPQRLQKKRLCSVFCAGSALLL